MKNIVKVYTNFSILINKISVIGEYCLVANDVFRLFGREVYQFGWPNSGNQKTLFQFSFLVAF